MDTEITRLVNDQNIIIFMDDAVVKACRRFDNILRTLFDTVVHLQDIVRSD